jgi:hypothetical protein
MRGANLTELTDDLTDCGCQLTPEIIAFPPAGVPRPVGPHVEGTELGPVVSAIERQALVVQDTKHPATFSFAIAGRSLVRKGRMAEHGLGLEGR